MNNTDTNNKEDQKQNASEEAVKADQNAVTQEKSLEEKYAELNDKYVRLYADFENFRKRATKERVDLIKYASEDMFKQIIPVLDDFERAFKSIKEATDINIIKQGEELIYNKFKGILVQNGLQEMKSAGEKFDPEIHDAVTNVPAPTEDKKGKVIDEVEKGYYLNGKVIRHAKVIVGN
ncbi:MAG TPA: nucleotide exchange factor GrpE [Bacteroidia bacterium]|jgi:molecular chaperone GrpE|nr:nucleotide exchange factor GrpE [Bacteroidia bacterium]